MIRVNKEQFKKTYTPEEIKKIERLRQEMRQRLTMTERERRLHQALNNLITHIDTCPQYHSPGVGGQTIEANMKQTKIRNVSLWEVEQAREALYD